MALNDTRLLVTFSSCQGHFSKAEQKMQDRNFADVRFRIASGVRERSLQALLEFIITEFWALELPVEMEAYKKYIPGQCGNNEPIYVITLAPIDRFQIAKEKRKMIDHAIAATTVIVKGATRLLEEGKKLVPEKGDFRVL